MNKSIKEMTSQEIQDYVDKKLEEVRSQKQAILRLIESKEVEIRNMSPSEHRLGVAMALENIKDKIILMSNKEDLKLMVKLINSLNPNTVKLVNSVVYEVNMKVLRETEEAKEF